MTFLNSLHFTWDLESISILVFSLIFLIVGISRRIELKGIGLKPNTLKLLQILHISGCFLFSASLILAAINLHQDCQTLTFTTFVVSMVFLAPGQFRIGMAKRKLFSRSP